MEEANFDKEKVIWALKSMSDCTQTQIQLKKIEKYLYAFENSYLAWAVCCEILETKNLDNSIYHQVAMVLKTKLKFDIHGLPQSEYMKIARLILKLIIEKNPPKDQLSQYLLCLSYLCMHGFQIIGDLVDIMEQNNMQMIQRIQFITFMADVAEDKRIIISKKQKDMYLDYLQQTIKPKVFALLHTVGENADTQMKFAVLDAFQEWFFVFRRDETLIQTISKHSCFQLALDSMNNDALAETARSCINPIIKAVRKPEQYPEIFETIFKYILDYMNRCKQLLDHTIDIDEEGEDGTPNNSYNEEAQDLEHIFEYVKVFRAFGIKFAKMMILQVNQALVGFLQLMIQLTANQKMTPEILEELNDFWEAFSEEFVNLLKEEQYSHKKQDFYGLLKSLVLIVINRMKMTKDQLVFFENRFYASNQDEEDEDASFYKGDHVGLQDKNEERKICKKIIFSVQDIIGFQATFQIIVEALNQRMLEMEQLTLESSDGPKWDFIGNLESIVAAASGSILQQDERLDLSDFFQAVMQLNFNCAKFNITKIRAIEDAANKAIVNEQTMLIIFNYLAGNLTNVPLKDDAGDALIILCENWSSFVIKNFESFLTLRNKLDDNDDLLIALAVAIAQDTQSSKREEYLAQLCKPFAERISQSLANPNSNKDMSIIEQVQNNLKKMAMIFSKMPTIKDDAVAHPLTPVFQELWPLFKVLFNTYQHRANTLEKVCNTVLKCMKSLNTRFKPFILEFFDLVCQIFVVNPVPTFLYAIETSASTFGKVPDMIEPLTKVYEFVSNATLNYIADKGLKEHAQLIEDFFGMLFRYTKYVPSVVLSSSTLEINLHLSDLCIGIDEPNIEKTLYLFLEYLFKLCSYEPKNETEKVITQIIIQKYGSKYIRKLFLELTTFPPERLRDYICDIIFVSFYQLKQHTIEWLKTALQAVPESILVQTEKIEMIKDLEEIDVSHLKLSGEIEKDSEQLTELGIKFDKVFDEFLDR